ncbi:MAG: CDGSH iron-sulfur domain-containing protein [Dehalococcoidia bacterium]|nr:CDGSH iron-sulfur domain-containing protein [Dehalococcoidia bacterium]
MGKSIEKPRIEPLQNGPLKVTGLNKLVDSEGNEFSCKEQMLLCRCGRSSHKPFCDGSHTRVGFQDSKIEGRMPDRVRSYEGKDITIHDNRGVCSHAEHCIRELPQVFDRSRHPWIDANAASADDIARTVEHCPSGALSYTRNGVLHKNLPRNPAIEVQRGGPYNVVGGPEFVDPRGCVPESEEHCTLCRCGASRNKPFCDGSHWLIEFDTVESEPER